MNGANHRGGGKEFLLWLAAPAHSGKLYPAADSATTNTAAQISLTTQLIPLVLIFIKPFSVAATIGNASGGTNTANLINVAAVTGDAEVTLNAINIGALTGTGAAEYALSIGAGWDRGISLGANPIAGTAAAIDFS